MYILDAHQHFWTRESIISLFESLGDPLDGLQAIIRDFRPRDLRPILDKLGISETIVVQVNSTLENTQFFLDLAAKNDWIAGVVGWVDLADPDVGTTLDSIDNPKLVGIRHQWHDEPDPAWIMQPSVLRGLREVARHGLVYELLVKPREWEYIPKVVEAVPELSYVIDHVGKPNIAEGQMDDWIEAMKVASSFPNMYCKISGMITEAKWHEWTVDDLRPYVEKVVDIFGTNRVMFGSDWPVCLLSGTYEQWFGAIQEILKDFSGRDKELIFGENARKFYKIHSWLPDARFLIPE